jgi:hypothetical protein
MICYPNTILIKNIMGRNKKQKITLAEYIKTRKEYPKYLIFNILNHDLYISESDFKFEYGKLGFDKETQEILEKEYLCEHKGWKNFYTHNQPVELKNFSDFEELFNNTNSIYVSESETTKRENFFKHSVEYYFKKYGLDDYELTIDVTTDDDVRGCCWWSKNRSDKQITIEYNFNWIREKNTTYNEIEKVAFHETWEALLSELNECALGRFVTETEIQSAVHTIIRKMENIYFKGEMCNVNDLD